MVKREHHYLANGCLHVCQVKSRYHDQELAGKLGISYKVPSAQGIENREVGWTDYLDRISIEPANEL